MASRERADVAAERFVRTAQDSYQRVLDHTMALQERNTRFAQDMLDAFYREYRQQAEANRAVTQELLEHAEEQYEASMDLFYAPLSYYKEGPYKESPYKEGLKATR
jgi:cellobiose phosphorylase